MTHLEELEEFADGLITAFRMARDELQREIEHGIYRPGTQPGHMRDSSGRFILLDALTTIVQAKATIAQIREGRNDK
jgi:hypothetical protein